MGYATARDWFGDATFDEVLDCILNNLTIGPKIIEDTTKSFLIRNHLKSRIDQLEVDLAGHHLWYDIMNAEDKTEFLFTKIEIGKGHISLSRSSGVPVPVPTPSIDVLHTGIIDIGHRATEFIHQKRFDDYLQATTSEVKLLIITKDCIADPSYIFITLKVTAGDRKHIPSLDKLALLLGKIKIMVSQSLQTLG